MRKEFEMTGEELNELLEACRLIPAMYLSGGTPMFGTPQENANRAWQRLGEKHDVTDKSPERWPRRDGKPKEDRI
jgi:hypothetical protein